MAKNRSRKKKNKNSTGKHDALGVTLIVISAFLLLCIAIKPILGIFSEAIFSVLLGVFGIASYPALIALLILGIMILGGRKSQAETKTKVCIALAVVFGLIILQLASTHAFLNRSFSAYLSATYSAKYSVGGVVVGFVAYGLKTAVTEVACYVFFSAALLLDILIMTSTFSRIHEWRKNRAMKEPVADLQPPAPAPIDEPAQPQRVIDATPLPGLFTGKIERNTSDSDMETESGRFTDMPTDTRRQLSDYSSSAVMDDTDKRDERPLDHSAAAAAARVRLYSDREEITRQAVDTFRAAPPEPEPELPPEPVQEPDDYQPERPAIMEPAARVDYDMQQNAERPRRVDYDGTPNNLNALYFPPTKNIQFNDDGIEEIMDEPHAAPVQAEPERPAFGEVKSGTVLEPVQPIAPIIDASQPLYAPDAAPLSAQQPISLSAEDRFLRTFGADSQSAQSAAPVFTAPADRTPPLESDRFKTEEIFDASDELSAFGSSSGSADFEQEEILDGSMPYEPETDGLPEIEELKPDNGLDAGILDGSLVISDEPAVDMSERQFDNGDVFTGEDLSGLYVSADDIRQPASGAAKERAKPKKSAANAPLENQLTIEGIIREQAQESVVVQESKRYKQYDYKAPPYDLLKIYEKLEFAEDELHANAQILEDVVSRFLKTQVKVINIVPGPQVTRYELDIPSGPSVKAVEARAVDIAYELAAVGGVRVEAPIPGKRAVGIEVPNKSRSIVGLREIVESPVFIKHKSNMVFSVGKDIGGDIVVCDLEKIPHFLIAGQTGAGKSAGLNSLLVSLLFKASPDDLRFILIDPKRVEFSKFRGMPHLLFERVITEPNDALNALKWADKEMNRRYTVIQQFPACSKLSEYNNMPEVKSGKLGKLPHIVIIIDELANLMQSSVSGEIETKISSIAALARAVGIHLIVATQRPSADVVTGTIKANLSSRIAYKVPDITNSRIIIDNPGAEALAGDGDMLFYPHDASGPRRVQGSYVSGEEVVAVVTYLKEHYECDFDEEAENAVFGSGGGSAGGDGEGGNELDPLASRIMAHAIRAKQISTSVIQRRFSMGYSRAARIIDNMEALGYVGPLTGNSKPRDVLMTVEQYKEVFGHDLDDN